MKRKNALFAVALIAVFSISLFASLAYVNLFQLSVAPSARIRPISLNSVSFKVYDKQNSNPIGSSGNQPIGTATNDPATNVGRWNGGDRYPDIECFTSEPFFVNSLGGPVTQPVLMAEYAVVNGIEYIATGTYYGIDVGARTHANLGAISHPTTYSAYVSPFDGFPWNAETSYLGVKTSWSDTISSSDPKHSDIKGSVAFSCDAGKGLDILGTVVNRNNFYYVYGSKVPGARQAQITQSLSPFFSIGSNPAVDPNTGRLDNLDYAFFGKTWSQYQGLQLDYVKNYYKIKPVYVVPEVTVETQSSPIWAPYTKEVTFLNGTTATMTTKNTQVLSGFRGTYIANLTQYEQTGQITSNTFNMLTGNADMPTEPATASKERDPNADYTKHDLNGVSGSAGIEGSLLYNGPETSGGTAYQPGITGAADAAENLAGLPKGDYHFSITNKGAISNFKTQATVSTTYTLQPAASIGWTDQHVNQNYYIWSGRMFYEFNKGGPSTYHINYPYALWVNNMYVVQRWVIEVWTLSTYNIELTANGKPVTVMPSDHELTSLVNDPNKDNNVQYIPIPKVTDWLFVAEVVGIIIVALIVLGIIGAAMLRKQSVNVRVSMPRQQSWFDQEIGAPQQRPMPQQRPPKKQQPERINKPPPKKGKGIGDWFKEKLNPKPPPRYRFHGRKNKS